MHVRSIIVGCKMRPTLGWWVVTTITRDVGENDLRSNSSVIRRLPGPSLWAAFFAG
jgi:hypothetical protein